MNTRGRGPGFKLNNGSWCGVCALGRLDEPMGVTSMKDGGILDPATVKACFVAYDRALRELSPDMQVSDAVRYEVATGILDLAMRGVCDPSVLQAAGISSAGSLYASGEHKRREHQVS